MVREPEVEQAKELEGINPGGYALLVESAPGFLVYYCEVFSELGFTPLAVTTYEAASAYLRLIIFDFVVVDLRGLALETGRILDRLRNLPARTRVFAVTRPQETDLRHELLGLGNVELLRDPVTYPDMMRVLNSPPRRRANPVLNASAV